MGRKYTSFIRMKKTLLALFAVLLVLSLAACDFLMLPPDAGDGGSRYPDANDGMVCLTIGAGGGGTSRALDRTLAEIDADYFEVVFKYGSDYYQAEWSTNGGEAQIRIPTGDYSGEGEGFGNDAVLFAGKEIVHGEYVLLGVGVIGSTFIGEDEFLNKKIAWNTTQVTFLMSALTNNVNDNPLTSTFQITGPTSDVYNNNSYVTATTLDIGTVEYPVSSSVYYPTFYVPGFGSSGAYTNPHTTGGDIEAEYSVTILNYGKVILKDDWSVSPVTIASLTATETVEYKVISPTAVGLALPAPQKFTFEIDVSNVTANGLYAFSIDVPVCALTSANGVKKKEHLYENTGDDYTQTWHIRGGIANNLLDGGVLPPPDYGSPGGAVLLELVPY
jgi:hypothetical protein